MIYSFFPQENVRLSYLSPLAFISVLRYIYYIFIYPFPLSSLLCYKLLEWKEVGLMMVLMEWKLESWSMVLSFCSFQKLSCLT